MAADIVMPRLSDSMGEGTVLAWLNSVGEEVAVGDELVEIETDKANMVYDADAAGTLVRDGQITPPELSGGTFTVLTAATLAPASARANVEAGVIYLHHRYHLKGGDRDTTVGSYLQDRTGTAGAITSIS